MTGAVFKDGHMQASENDSEPPARQLPDELRSVGPGWHPLLLRLHERLVAVRPGYRVEHVTEKFGAARVELTTTSSEIRDLISEAEQESAQTCEFCGAPGRCRRRSDADRGWIKAVCDSCHVPWSHHLILIGHGEVWHKPTRP